MVELTIKQLRKISSIISHRFHLNKWVNESSGGPNTGYERTAELEPNLKYFP